MDLTAALTWAANRKNAVLITLRTDGRAQSSDISYLIEDGAFVISVTSDRAKTANMRRDNRVVVHLTDPGSWSYLSFDATVDISPTTTAVDDETADRLVAYYEGVAGEPHSDWAEYRQAMVDEGRLLLRVTPTSVVGQIH